ncbi:MAG TPA: hypothetical protein VJR46_11120 [Candidatus Dormibacteraeota bacterium]|nr:hypothetical protein [Candidatus Dormibacteraeota bacterium]
MTRLKLFLRDRDRAQRGSVLSGVLIITAFIAILSGALMTSLSANFIVAHDLITRTVNEATIHSSLELAIDRVQNTQLTSACPNLSPAPTLNGLNTSVTYLSCALVTDSSPAAIPIAGASPVALDGTYFSLPGVLPGSGNEYLAVDSNGTLYGYTFGAAAAAWQFGVGGMPTAPPTPMAAGYGEIADLVPERDASGNYGVAVIEETTPGQPSLKCTMATGPNAKVAASPAASRNPSGVAYFGDQGGTLYAYDASARGSCGQLGSSSAGDPIVAGPVVFPGSTAHNDRLFVVTADTTSSALVEYRYSGNTRSLTRVASLDLPAPSAVGLDVDSTSLPARIAITFANGTVAIVQVSTSSSMAILGTTVAATSLAKPPTWCLTCRGGNGAIGVGGPGGVFVYDTRLNLHMSLNGVSIATSPTPDAGGDWFAGGSNGALYELNATTLIASHVFPVGSGAITSTPVVNPCPQGLCVYFGASGSNAFLIPLDQRDVTVSACIFTQGSCASGTPRLWAHVAVGAAGNAQAVRVLGFSYYSP